MIHALRIITVSLVLFLSGISFSIASTGFSALVIEPKTGRILYEYNANTTRYPASVTKVMTLYIIFEDLAKKRVTLDKMIRFSSNAAGQEPSKLGAKAGESITLDLAIKALIVKSANDVAVAVAETLSKNETAFIKRMNQTARRLGLNNTHFVNPNGLFDERQTTTAHDLATLGVAIYNHFPQYYPLFKLDAYYYKGVKVTGHNRVNQRLSGADGIKTGYIRRSGFNLLTSASQGNTRLFAVVLGGKSTPIRDNFMIDILTQSFDLIKKRDRKSHITPTLTEDMIVGYQPAKGKVPQKISGGTKTATPITNSTIPMRTTGSPASNQNLPTVRLLSQSHNYNEQSASIDYSAKAAIQVGAYARYRTAQEKARLVHRQVKQGKISIISDKGNKLHRARLTGFNRASAEKACEKLKSSGTDCIVVIL